MLSPFLVLGFHFGSAGSIEGSDFWWAFKNTMIQSVLSAILSLLIGFIGALGLIGWSSILKPKAFNVIEGILIFPNIVPSLFVILSALKFIDPFPFGKIGIAIVHTMMSAGLVSVVLSRIFQSKLLGISELALIEGASSLQFIRVAVFGYLRRDLVFIALYLFSSSFASFSVPLAVGGGQGTTVEVLIYEAIMIKGSWSEALSLSLIQSLLIFFLALFPSQPSRSRIKMKGSLKLLSTPTFIIFPIGISAAVLAPIVTSIFGGFKQLEAIQFQIADFFHLQIQSLQIGLATGFLTLSLFSLILVCYNQSWLQGLLRGYIAPSTVLVGFSMLIIPPPSWWPSSIGIGLGLTLIFAPSLYRLGFDQRLRNMYAQILQARILGAGPFQICTEIIFPQMGDALGFSAGIASFWAIGDFAFSGIVSSGDNSLALLIHSLMSNYRINAALFLSLSLLILGILTFGFFIGVGHVFGRKPRN